MTVDLIIKGGKILIEGFLVEACLAIDNGKIVAISKETLPSADKTINVNRKIILPGFIDPHIHFRDPGQTGEDFETGTMAAAGGGVTTVFDMPGTKPNVSSALVFKEKLEIVKKKAYVDFALYGAVEPTKMDEISSLAKAGAIGFKIFTGIWPPPHPYPPLNNAGDIYEAFSRILKTGLPVCVHCETLELLDYFGKKLMDGGRKDALSHPASRPNIVEADSISRCIMFAENLGVKLYLCHVSTKEGVEMVRLAKRAGQDVKAETCPHYLLLGENYLKKLGSIAKMNPPLRTERDIEALWKGLGDGTIDVISSDHSPQSKESKEINLLKGGIWTAKPGLNGIETRVPLMLNEVNAGRLTLADVTKTMIENPAKIFGIYPRKGVLAVGSDADITIIDLSLEKKIDQEKIHSKVKITPFHGRKVKGIPILTMVRGQIIMENNEIVGQRGHGEFIKPDLDVTS